MAQARLPSNPANPEHIDRDPAPLTWEKPTTPQTEAQRAALKRLQRGSQRWKFLIGGALILGAIAYLIVSGTLTGQRFFVTVDNLVADAAAGVYAGETVRVSGAVLGDTITNTLLVDDVTGRETQRITFTIVHIPDTFDNLAEALHIAVNDADATRMPVVYEGTMPDLLQHEAQAILTGTLGDDGVFYATELLLKCPSRFEGEGEIPMGEDHPGMDAIGVESADAG